MPENKTPHYQTNFIIALKRVMIDRDMSSIEELGDWMGLKKGTIYKLYTQKQFPTVEQCLKICEKGGYSPNWLFLNIGEMFLEHQSTINELAQLLERRNKILAMSRKTIGKAGNNSQSSKTTRKPIQS